MAKDKLDNNKITIIGAGNMGKAIVQGLIRNNILSSKNIVASDPALKKMQALKKLGVELLNDNKKVAHNASVIILAVKPDIIPNVLSEIKEKISNEQLIISIAAGIKIKTIRNLLGAKQPIVRVMPNLCATIGMSVSCWTASNEVSHQNRKLVKKILRAIGTEYFIGNESKFDQITAISGSGPAYIFYLAELLEEAAKKVGLQKNLSKILAVQTIIGSAELMKNSTQSPKELRAGVTSKGGVTEAVFTMLKKHKTNDIFIQAVRAGIKRARELRVPR